MNVMSLATVTFISYGHIPL